MEKAARAIAGNDIVYLWWSYDRWIDGCVTAMPELTISTTVTSATDSVLAEPPDLATATEGTYLVVDGA